VSRNGLPADARTFSELLPLLRTLRNIVTNCRVLGAGDYLLPSEQNTDPATAGNVNGWDLLDLQDRVDVAGDALQSELDALQVILNAVPQGALNDDPASTPDLSAVDYDGMIDALVRLSNFGLSGALPRLPFLPELDANASDAERLALLRARQSLIQQGLLAHEQGTVRRKQGRVLSTFSDLTDEQRNRLTPDEKAGIFQRAAALILGDSLRVVPTFTFGNGLELEAARAFGTSTAPGEGLLRFTQSRLAAAAAGSSIRNWRSLAIDEWLQGVAAVRRQARLLDQLQTYQDVLDRGTLPLEALQLPFDAKAHWIAVEFPEVTAEQLDDPNVFVPRGDFLSVVRQLPEGYDGGAPQAGLLIDEWNEVIPNRVETTGVAIHYNQPNTEPPQCVLVAVSPTIKGRWEWDDLVETLIDTFDRAKRRAVEPDVLRTTPYAQVLPAVLSTFTSFPFGTISTNLSVQPASLVFQEGQ
jgi:hypothetical protein